MNEDVIKAVLAPVPGGSPCGEDVSALAEYGLLQDRIAEYAEFPLLQERALAEGTAPPADRPEWGAILARVAALSAKGKHLRVGTWALVALTAKDGLPGLVQGAEVVAKMIEAFWPDLHPQVVPGDSESLADRLLILAELQEQTVGVSSFVRVLLRVPLVRTAARSFCWCDMQRAAGRLPALRGAAVGLDTKALRALTGQADVSTVDAAIMALDAAARSFQRAHAVLLQAHGEERSAEAGLGGLASLLADVAAQVRRLAGEAAGGAEPGDVEPAAQVAAGAPGTTPAGEAKTVPLLQSSRDVVRLLDQICAWYARNEPSSPVPLLLKRARDWSGQDFRSLVLDISKAAEQDLNRLFGVPKAPPP